MNHEKAKRIAQKWSRNEPPQSNARLLAGAYLEVVDLAQTLSKVAGATFNEPVDGCECEGCTTGRTTKRINEVLGK